MKQLDTRYGTIKVFIESGHIKSFQEIFTFIPKTVVYKDLGVNFNRFDRAIKDPSKFKLDELLILAEFFEVDSKKFVDMAYEQALAYRKMEKIRLRNSRPVFKTEKPVDTIIQKT